ncbi:MAG: transcriptional regulator with GAF, ATPase, and Fis domain, partial [Candidatus Latescibacterota bacterium]
DYITKPFREREVLARVQTHLQLNQLNRQLAWQNVLLEEKVEELERSTSERQALKGQLNLISEREAAHWGLEGFVGKSSTMRRIFEEIRLMQESATTSVLIEGESGTGKELIARAIHFGSPRSQEPFVPVNCAAFPSELVESLLFGHRKGAFTGAHEDRVGFFEMAHQGTLFLDEIGEMPLELQSKLLRVLEDGKVQRVGEQEERQVDVRVVAATNVDVQQLIGQNKFRRDLYFRLARFVVTAPPLRERVEDIPLLAQHFMHLFAREMGRDAASLSTEAHAALCAYAFPGNVRELKNIIERALIESRGLEIQAHHLHFLAAPQRPTSDGEVAPIDQKLPDNLDAAVEQTERYLVKRALDRTAGNIAETARLLGTNRNRIYRVLEQDKDAD